MQICKSTEIGVRTNGTGRNLIHSELAEESNLLIKI